MAIHTSLGKIFIFFCVLVFGISGYACGESTPPLQIAVIGDYPPYDIYTDGEASGIATDMMKEVFTRLGMPITIQQLPFKRALEYVKNGDVDTLAGLGKNPEREQNILYPNTPLATTTVVFFVRKGSPIVYHGDLKDMKPYTIGTALGFMYNQEFKDLVDQGILQTEESKTVKSNIQMLVGKRYEVFIANSAVTLYTAKQLGVSEQIQELTPPVSTGYMYLGISRHSPLASVVERINEVILEIEEDGTKEQIISRYTK